VCASGRSAGELLSDIEARLGNDPEHERTVAMREQGKITALRLRKLVGSEEES
jgi:2-oxo-4-hydroxy-4-carboxy-5-ureidoimidazoline decarboxylase